MTVLLITVNGTGVPDPFDDGPTSFPGWAGWAVADFWIEPLAQLWGPQWQQEVFWQPIGYPASVENPSMGSSVIQGAIGNGGIVPSILTPPSGPAWPLGTSIVLDGYSQGAMAVNYVWVNECLNPNGALHDRYLNGDIKAIFNMGDPNRSPGIANGNLLAGIPLPPEKDGQVTGGIAGPGVPSKNILGCLTPAQTPDYLYSFVLPGDLYADAPVGINPWSDESAVGYVETGIFNVVQDPTVTDVVGVLLDLGHPLGTIEGIINSMTFFGEGGNAPHFQYGPYVATVLSKLQEIVEAA